MNKYKFNQKVSTPDGIGEYWKQEEYKGEMKHLVILDPGTTPRKNGTYRMVLGHYYDRELQEVKVSNDIKFTRVDVGGSTGGYIYIKS